MTELTNYRCDICGEVYMDEESCHRCEAFHVGPASLESMNFQPIAKNKPPYPAFLLMKMNDGAVVRYAANEIVNVPKVDKGEPETPSSSGPVFGGKIESVPVGNDCGADE